MVTALLATAAGLAGLADLPALAREARGVALDELEHVWRTDGRAGGGDAQSGGGPVAGLPEWCGASVGRPVDAPERPGTGTRDMAVFTESQAQIRGRRCPMQTSVDLGLANSQVLQPQMCILQPGRGVRMSGDEGVWKGGRG